MKVAITQVIENNDEYGRETFAELDFKALAESANVLSVDQTVRVSNDNLLQVFASYELSTKHLSVFVKEGDIHIFSAVFKWDGGGVPYFAFCQNNGRFTELSFEM
jgi:hypothetical protein